MKNENKKNEGNYLEFRCVTVMYEDNDYDGSMDFCNLNITYVEDNNKYDIEDDFDINNIDCFIASIDKMLKGETKKASFENEQQIYTIDLEENNNEKYSLTFNGNFEGQNKRKVHITVVLDNKELEKFREVLTDGTKKFAIQIK